MEVGLIRRVSLQDLCKILVLAIISHDSSEDMAKVKVRKIKKNTFPWQTVGIGELIPNPTKSPHFANIY